MKFLANLIDRLIFIAVFLFAMQLPHFIDLYQQRLEGFTQANQQQLEKFQQMANTQNLESVAELADRLRLNQDHVVQQTGELVAQTLEEQTQLEQAVHALDSNSLTVQLWGLLLHLRPALAKATFNHFEPAVKLRLPALSCGLIAAILVSWLKWMLFHGLRRRRRSFRPGRNPLQ